MTEHRPSHPKSVILIIICSVVLLCHYYLLLSDITYTISSLTVSRNEDGIHFVAETILFFINEKSKS